MIIFLAVSVLLTFILYGFSGPFLGNLLWTKETRKLEKSIWGSVIAIALNCYITVITTYIFGWNTKIIIPVIIAINCLLILISKFVQLDQFNGSQGLKRNEITACSVIAGCVIAVLVLTFLNVGIETSNGYRYNWLFGHDFINKAVNTVSLTQGVPVKHYFFAGEYLRYYILSYSLSALPFSVLNSTENLHGIIKSLSIWQSIFFVFCFAQFLKNWFNDKTLISLLVISFFCYSFYGWVQFLLKSGISLPQILDFASYSSVSHLFYRYFWVEPQTVLGLTIFLCILSIVNAIKMGNEITTGGILGTLIGIEFGVESILGLIALLTFSTTIIFRYIKGVYTIRSSFIISIVSATCFVLIYLSYIKIGIFSIEGSGGPIKFILNYKIFFLMPLMALLMFGPAAIFGVLGLIRYFKTSQKPNSHIDLVAVLGIISMIFAIFITHENEKIFGFLKVEKTIFIALMVFSGFYLEKLIESKKGQYNKQKKIAIYICIFGTLTLFSDIYFVNWSKNDGVIYVKNKDWAACQWIKDNIPKNAIVQSEPQYPGTKYYYSLIANFGQRRMAVGEWKVSGIKHDSGKENVNYRYQVVKNIFSSGNAQQANKLAKSLKIDYIYAGEYEKNLYKEKLKVFKDKKLFSKVYDKNNVEIYKVL